MSRRDLLTLGESLHVDTSTSMHDLDYMALLRNSSVHDQGKNEVIGNKPSISNAYSWDLSIVKGGGRHCRRDEGVAACGGEEGGL